MTNNRILRIAAVCALATMPLFPAQFTLIIADPPGVGFNDTTPAQPVGGNPGTTVGQQRRNVFVRAAQLWGAELNSNVPIRMEASWPALACSDTSAVLGAAGPTFIVFGTPGALPGYWYPVALGDKLAGQNLIPGEPDMVAFFNPNIGSPGCLPGISFYLGLDENPPPSTVHLLKTLLHEFAHGLGFLSFTDSASGEFCCGNLPLPSIYDRFLLDKTTGLHWDAMTDGQRASSAVNNAGKLVWDGALVTSSVPVVLGPAAEVRVLTPATSATNLLAGPSALGPSLSTPLTGELMPVTANSGLACTALTGLDSLAVAGKIAMVNRGGCPYTTKLKNLQLAGAVGAVIVNDNASLVPPNVDGIDPAITIPSVFVTQADAAKLAGLLQFRSRTSSGVTVRLGQSATRRAGVDEANRVYMYTPSPLRPGSSVSHWDVSPFPNLLMEPIDTPETDFRVKPPGDLTLPALQQLGW